MEKLKESHQSTSAEVQRRLGPDYGAADPSPREGADPDSIEALPTNVLIQVNAALEFLSEPEDPPSA